MDEHEAEEIVMNLVVHGGEARSCAIEAIAAARAGDFARADKLMSASSDALMAAHGYQSRQISAEMSPEGGRAVSLLMVHGQDHLMNAITTHDLAVQIIGLCRQLSGNGILTPQVDGGMRAGEAGMS